MATARKSRKLTPEQLLAEEEEAFRRQLARLLRTFQGQYVAVHRGRVVGHSADDEELARRMYAKLGDDPFYIGKVEREPTVYELPSGATF